MPAYRTQIQPLFHWANPQPSNGLKFKRWPPKNVIFYRQPSKMQIDVSRQKLSRYFKSHYISIDLDGSLAPEEFPNLKKSVPLFSKTLSLDITNVHYNWLTVNPLLTPLPSILILHKQLTWTDQLWFIQAGSSYCLWSSAA